MGDKQDLSDKTVSLVLGSGGARGLAHIGAIRELVNAGAKIESIAGCSMGAVVGGIFAAGHLDDYEDWVRGLGQSDVLRLIDWTFSGSGLIKGRKIISKLSELVGELDIEDLSLDFTAVAVDIDRSKEVWLNRGPLFDAIRASIAIPGIFTPHHYMNRNLVDGGLLNPIPVAPTLRCMTDLTVVVDVNGPPDPALDADDEDGNKTQTGMMAKLRKFMGIASGDDNVRKAELGLLDVMMHSLDTMEAAVTRQQLAIFQPDLVISIPKNACMVHEFHRADEVIELGAELTRKKIGDHRLPRNGPTE